MTTHTKNSRIRKELQAPFPRAYWVIPGLLLAGEYPAEKNPAEAKQKLGKLIDAGVRQIVNLMETQETDHTGQHFTPYEDLFAELGQERNIRVGGRRATAVCLLFAAGKWAARRRL